MASKERLGARTISEFGTSSGVSCKSGSGVTSRSGLTRAADAMASSVGSTNTAVFCVEILTSSTMSALSSCGRRAGDRQGVEPCGEFNRRRGARSRLKRHIFAVNQWS